MKCLDCDKEFRAETSEDALSYMHPHYMEAHKEVMAEATDEKKKAWMETFHKAWNEAPEE